MTIDSPDRAIPTLDDDAGNPCALIAEDPIKQPRTECAGPAVMPRACRSVGLGSRMLETATAVFSTLRHG